VNPGKAPLLVPRIVRPLPSLLSAETEHVKTEKQQRVAPRIVPLLPRKMNATHALTAVIRKFVQAETVLMWSAYLIRIAATGKNANPITRALTAL